MKFIVILFIGFGFMVNPGPGYVPTPTYLPFQRDSSTVNEFNRKKLDTIAFVCQKMIDTGFCKEIMLVNLTCEEAQNLIKRMKLGVCTGISLNQCIPLEQAPAGGR